MDRHNSNSRPDFELRLKKMSVAVRLKRFRIRKQTKEDLP
jgi:hypothetical protein